MPPRSTFIPKSSLNIKPVATRDNGLILSSDRWLEEKKDIEGAEGFWRVHDGIYDLTAFVEKHPGGAEWLNLTKGTDITEAFEVHHLTDLPKEMLQKYFVKKAKTKRNSPYTFEEDGFYKTLRREIQPVLKVVPKQSYNNTNFFTDTLMVLTFIFSTFALKHWSFTMGTIGGLLLGMLTVAAHNYLHMRDNLRMYYSQFSLFQVRDWRISHILSHHLYTNTINDLEISMFEPVLQYLPIEKKPLQKMSSVLLAPLIWITFFHTSLIRRLIDAPKYNYQNVKLTDLSTFILPIFMYIFGGQSFSSCLVMWNFVIFVGSFYLGYVGLNAGHHHPEVFHDGDTPRSDNFDWGIGQLDALLDRNEITGSHFLVLTNFGDHALHHFFPTLDHGTLEHLYPVFKKVCKQFDVDLRTVSLLETTKGSFQQLIRTTPNPSPTNLKKFSKD
ncbi:unnamed protein product [Psylliodes chrysocephalus]|uniref:Cytochrome b5-related protein n=1 Tax=Psylliodes chrysocephalus TaxID=3402493 RepID=A0A9P0D0U0_9CUCU|nr:unnamed protein product [Psylliodes chrysocephala]